MSFSHNPMNNMPLTALRAFTMVGRHRHFTRAATALGVTQGAVSRHIAALESYAGCRLFNRRGSSIEFTPDGLQLFEAVKDAMSTLELTMQLLAQRGQRHDRLKVRTSMPSFAMTVVVPALGDYLTDQGVHVDVITSLSPPQATDDFDVLITRDLSLSGAESWELVREELVCVGSPALLARHRTHDKQDWPMVASRSRPDMLAVWAVAANIAPDRLHVRTTYDHLFLAIMAAVGGAGFLVAPRLLLQDQLKAGALELAESAPVASGASYVAFLNTHSAHAQSGRAFCRWLKARLRPA